MKATPVAAPTTSIEVLASPHCPRECRLRAVVEADALIGLEADEGQAPCPCCVAAVRDFQAGALVTPLRPRAARRLKDGSHDLVPIPWGESLDRLARAFTQIGQGERRLVWIHAADRPRLSAAYAFRVGALAGEVVHLHQQTDTQRLATMAEAVVPEAAWRDPATGPGARVVAWGVDPASSPAVLRRAVLRGECSTALAIDPRRSATARRAGLHLAPRPGTDGALALALAAGLAEREGIRDPRLAGWSLARAAEICQIPAAALTEAVETLVGQAPTLVVGAGLLGSSDPRAALEALVLLAERAGTRLLLPRRLRSPAREVPAPEPRGPVREFDSAHLEDFLAEARPAAEVVIVEGGDPLVGWSRAGSIEEYLSRARLVIVLADHLTPVCRQADLVLPVAGALERADLEARHWGEFHRWGRAALEPARERYSPQRIWAGIARRLQWPGQWLAASPEQLAEQITTIAGPAPQAGAVSRPPVYREAGEGPLATPQLHRAFPLQLVVCTELGVADAGAVPSVVLAADDARCRGIGEGNPVVVHNERGRVEARAVIDPGQRRGVVVMARRQRAADGPAALLDPAAGRGPCLVEVDGEGEGAAGAKPSAGRLP